METKRGAFRKNHLDGSGRYVTLGQHANGVLLIGARAGFAPPNRDVRER